LEVIITSSFSDTYGGLWLFVEILLSGVVGAVIISNFKYSLMESLSNVYKGQMSQQELISSSILSLVGAVLIIVPGVFTDIIGLLMQFEVLALMISRPFIKHRDFNSTNFRQTSTHQSKKDDDIIDVEVISK